MPVLLCSVLLCHLISQINNSAGYLWLVSDKSWKVRQEQSNGVTYISLHNRVYDSELVTTKILYFNYIHLCKKCCIYVQTYKLITLLNRRDNFHCVSKCNDFTFCNYLQFVYICMMNSLYKVKLNLYYFVIAPSSP